jgi:PAS domain S-box-containing protein
VLCAADYDVQMDEVVSLEDFDSEVDGQSVDMVLAAEADVDLNVLSTAATRCPVVVLGVDSEERAASLLQSGAEDCVPAANLARLPFVVKRCLRQARERQARQEADAARLHIEEQYREHVENANDVVFTIDLQGNFTYWNRAGEAISGYTRDEIHTLNMAQVLAPESLNIVAHMIRQKLADNRSTVYDLVMVAKSGEHIPLEVSTRLLFQDDAPVGAGHRARCPRTKASRG